MSRIKNNGATLGFEETLWGAADKMRGHMDPSEYKYIVHKYMIKIDKRVTKVNPEYIEDREGIDEY